MLSITFFAAVLVLSPVAVLAEQNARFTNVPAIEVTAMVSETRVPDRVHLSFLVVGKGLTSEAALKDVSGRIRGLTEAIHTAGIADSETKSLGPITEILYRHFYEGGREIVEKREPAGYRATYELKVSVGSADQAGMLVAPTLTLGATLNQVRFEVSDRAAVVEKLRSEAVAKAVAQARREIAAAGAKPGRILEIGHVEENGSEMADLASKPSPSREPKDFSVYAYAIRPGTETISTERRVVMEILPN